MGVISYIHGKSARSRLRQRSLTVAALNASAPLGGTIHVDKPRWRLTEEEIVGASMTVILVSLMVVISVAVGTALTMS
ncbi:hypothetical protein A5622_04360 [Mycobacterium sp. 1245801.1]|nr:hypothetical protein A5622_04360 [Mycobacterium sp. 1245801.1]